jgi:hypothetical protein
MISGMMAGLSYLLSHPPTASEYAVNDGRLYALETEGETLLLVGHSQGNLFLNQAYDYSADTWGKENVAAAHIAPASPTLRGPYVLADIDVVINALRVQGGASVPPVNMSLPLSSSDWSGHSLIDTYLDPARSARAQVVSMMKNGLADLNPPLDLSLTTRGSFTVSMAWNGLGNEDLIIFEPDGKLVSDWDNHAPGGSMTEGSSSNGAYPEIFYATCEPSRFQTGTYHVAIFNDGGAENKIATLQVATPNDGVIFTKSLSTGPPPSITDSTHLIPAFDFIVTKGASSGEYLISFQ